MNKMEVSRADTYCVKSINEHVCEIKYLILLLVIIIIELLIFFSVGSTKTLEIIFHMFIS